MLHKAWNSKGEMPYRFPRSSVKFQGHTVQNMTDFDPNWMFPDYRPVAAFKSLRFALLYIHFTLGCSGEFSKQAALWRWLSELMVNMRTFWCDLTGSKLKKRDRILMQNCNVILLNLMYFSDWVAPGKRFLYGYHWDPTPKRRVPWGYSAAWLAFFLHILMFAFMYVSFKETKSLLGTSIRKELHILFLMPCVKIKQFFNTQIHALPVAGRDF